MNTKLLRLKILDLAFRGKLTTHDTADEHASELLKGIRAEKERLTNDGVIRRDKKDSIIYIADDGLTYEKLADDTITCIDEETPYDLPDGWAWSRINGVFIVNPRNNANDDTMASFVPMPLINDAFNNHFTYQERPWGEIKTGFTHFRDGDVGLAKITPCLENRKSVIFTGLVNGIGAGTTELHIFRPIVKDLILPEYLLWFFKTERFINDSVGAFSGAVGQQRVGKDFVASYLLPVPPVTEQARIVQAIELAFEQISNVEEEKDYLQAYVTAAKAKIVSFAIQGKLVPQDPKEGHASALIESAQRIDDVPFEIPDNWIWCKLDDAGTTNIGLTYKPSEICPDGVPVLRSNNIQNGKLDLSELVRVSTPYGEALSLHEGDILICARNGSQRLVGKCTLIPTLPEPMTFGAFMAVYRSAFSRYIYYFLNSGFFREIFQTDGISTQINQLTQAMIKNALIPLPPFAEQQRIVMAIEVAFEQLDIIAANLN